MPLLRASPDARNAQLALVPDNMRAMVNVRLHQWEILPPPLQKEFLENENILGYFSQVNITNSVADSATPSAAEKSRWDSVPPDQRAAMPRQILWPTHLFP